MSRFACAAFVVAVCALTACRKTPPPPSPDAGPQASAHADEPEHEGMPKRVRLTPEVIAAAGIRSEPAARATLASAIELPGEIVADPDRTAQVAARMSGRLASVTFREGSAVKAGDALAVVRAPELGEVSSASQSLAAKAASARSNATRLEALFKSGLAAQQEVVAAQSEADALEAQSRAAAERLSAVGGAAGAGASLTLRAPIAGTVVARYAVVGQPVTPDETIATIVDLSEVWFQGRVFEQSVARVHTGARAEVVLNAYPAQTFAGVVEYLSQQIDPAARTLVARVRLTNREGTLRVGLFGTALVDSGEPSKTPRAILVARSAVTDIGGKSIVFVRHPDDDFELHEVILGRAALGHVEVLGGLREGEDVVTDGVFTLKSAVLRGLLQEEEEP
jgi:cobalt-zinc-cadmium efflux system membrane fusion protein